MLNWVLGCWMLDIRILGIGYWIMHGPFNIQYPVSNIQYLISNTEYRNNAQKDRRPMP